MFEEYSLASFLSTFHRHEDADRREKRVMKEIEKESREKLKRAKKQEKLQKTRKEKEDAENKKTQTSNENKEASSEQTLSSSDASQQSVTQHTPLSAASDTHTPCLTPSLSSALRLSALHLYPSPVFSRLVAGISGSLRSQLGGKLRLIACGGAPLSARTAQFLSLLLDCPLVCGYGMTEASGAIVARLPVDACFQAVGVPMPGVKVKLGLLPILFQYPSFILLYF